MWDTSQHKLASFWLEWSVCFPSRLVPGFLQALVVQQMVPETLVQSVLGGVVQTLPCHLVKHLCRMISTSGMGTILLYET